MDIGRQFRIEGVSSSKPTTDISENEDCLPLAIHSSITENALQYPLVRNDTVIDSNKTTVTIDLISLLK